MDKLEDLIGKRLNQHKLGESARASMVLNRANIFLNHMFPEAENEIHAFRLKDGILYIRSAGAVWSQELWACKDKLLEEIHREYGEKSVLKVLIKSLTSE